jgi:hypothetical protein
MQKMFPALALIRNWNCWLELSDDVYSEGWQCNEVDNQI